MTKFELCKCDKCGQSVEIKKPNGKSKLPYLERNDGMFTLEMSISVKNADGTIADFCKSCLKKMVFDNKVFSIVFPA